MECNQKKLSKKVVPSTSNVDTNNLIEHVLVFGEKSSNDDEVALLKPTNPCEELLKQKFDLAIISLVNDLKTLNDFALYFNEDNGHLEFHMRLNLLKELLMTLMLALFLISPLCVVVRLVWTMQCFKNWQQQREKRLLPLLRYQKESPRETKHLIMHLQVTHVTPMALVTLVAHTRKVIRGEGGRPKVVTCLAKKKGQKGAC
jgi:hypothetical protein